MTEHNKDTIRASIRLHLESFQAAGLVDVLRPMPQPTAVPTRTSHAEILPASQQNLASCQTLEEVQTVLGNCTRCKLHSARQSIVFGVGNPHATVMFIGEGPGADEDAQGLPFVGAAGQLLNKMIVAMGFQRNDVYITNVIKCRPPQNRNPETDEIESCSPFLKAQIKSIKPKIIVTLGKFASQYVCDTQIPITKLRGQFRDYQGIPVMPTFHPSFLLRNPEMKRPAWEDLQKVMEELKKLKPRNLVPVPPLA